MNDIVNSTSKLNFLMYNSIFKSRIFLYNQEKQLDSNNELKKVNTWLQLNKLSLNTDKSKFMLFHKKEHHRKLTFK